MPVWFIKEHAGKFEEWAILRTRSSSKPWKVRLSVFRKPNGSPQVQFYGGWKEFVVGNGLLEGDSLVFVLNVDARSEFQVYTFLGTEMSSSDFRAPARKWGNNSGGAKILEQNGKNSYAGRHKPYVVQRNIWKTGDLLYGNKAVQERQQNLGDRHSFDMYSEVLTGSERKGLASPNSKVPNFSRPLSAHELRNGRIEVPRSFVRMYGMQLQDDVELQSIHQESPVGIVTCRSSSEQRQLFMRAHFKGGWR